MTPYRAVVVGCGHRGAAHAAAYAEMSRARIVACCDLVPEKREQMAQQFGLRAYADAREMLEQEKPDLVHLATLPTTRVPLMSLVAEMGVPACTVEKPVATGVADWRELVALEAQAPTKFAVCHQFRWHTDLVRCREALLSGALGEVEFIDFSAGFNISGQGTHLLNYAFSLNRESPMVRVFGAASGFTGADPQHPAPDDTVGYVTFANGVRGLWSNGSTAPRRGDPKMDWQHVRLTAYASRGHVTWEEFGKWEISAPGGVERGDYGSMDAWSESNRRAQAAFHNAMLDWLEGGSRVPGTRLKQSLHEWQVVLALYASALWRRPIELAEFDPPVDLFAALEKALA